MTVLISLIIAILFMGLCFYVGFFFGFKASSTLTRLEVENTDRLIIKNTMYRVYKHCELEELNDLPDVLRDIPDSRNQEII